MPPNVAHVSAVGVPMSSPVDTVGEPDGANVGLLVRPRVGDETVGERVGETEGDADGDCEGDVLTMGSCEGRYTHQS